MCRPVTKKEPHHLERDEQLEDSSPHLRKNSIAVTQDDLNEKSSEELNTSLVCNEKESNPEKRKAVSTDNLTTQEVEQCGA